MVDDRDSLLCVFTLLPDEDAAVAVGRVSRAWRAAASAAAAADARRPRQRHPRLPPWHWREAMEAALADSEADGVAATALLCAAAWHARDPDQLRLLRWAGEEARAAPGPQRRARAWQPRLAAALAAAGVPELLAELGCVEGLKWADAKGLVPMPEALAPAAAAGGHRAAVEWALRGGLSPAPCDCAAAAAAGGGHRELLEWLLARGAWLDASLATCAALSGHFGLLRWLVEQRGCPLSASTSAAAAGLGDAAQLRWLLDRGCPINHRACEAAAGGGHLEALQTAVKAGGRLARRSRQLALRAGDARVLRWLHDRAFWPRDVLLGEAEDMGCAAAAALLRAWQAES
jgi:hypothetical protein